MIISIGTILIRCGVAAFSKKIDTPPQNAIFDVDRQQQSSISLRYQYQKTKKKRGKKNGLPDRSDNSILKYLIKILSRNFFLCRAHSAHSLSPVVR